MENINLGSDILTTADFDKMNWHDSKLYAVAFGIKEHELSFDIDYILKWTKSEENEDNFKFLVAPASLVFQNVYDLNIKFTLLDAIIDAVYMDNPVQPTNAYYIKEHLEYDWTIETTNGVATFKSTGFKLFFRKSPILLDEQQIDLSKRGGITF